MAVEEEPGIAAFEEGGQEPEHVAASGVEGSSTPAASKETKPSVYKCWEQNLANDPNEPGSRFFPEVPDKKESIGRHLDFRHNEALRGGTSPVSWTSDLHNSELRILSCSNPIGNLL